ncbi:MAG TPA: hypothetical protein VLN73_02310 [Alphaproteobacteria bacterium]|nr:hypothetical protein [Alphaproteobacteria bacterium]
MAAPPTIIVHDLSQTLAALAAAEAAKCPVRLESARGAAGFAGAGWFKALADEARAAHPEAMVELVLDCGSQPGLALAAIREGISLIRLSAPARVRRKVAAIAAAEGAHLVSGRRGRVLDLLDVHDPEKATADWLAGASRRGGKAP